MLLGDHDRRSRNFLVTSKGYVYCIDRGESAIIENMIDWTQPVDDAKIISWLQERYKLYRNEMQRKWVIIDAVNMFISNEDIGGALQKVKGLKDAEIDDLLSGVFDRSSDEFKNASLTLKTRRDNLEILFPAAAKPTVN